MEKRRHPRMEIEPLEIVIERIECKHGIFQDAAMIILNVSHEGMRFRSSIDFDMEENITLLLPSMEIESLIKGIIRWKHQVENEPVYEYGLEIMGP